MRLEILGKQRKGEKDFTLNDKTEFGYNIECYKEGFVLKVYNLEEIIWMNRGANVWLHPMLDKKIDIASFERIVFKIAKKKEDKEQETFYT